ncbi:MAG: uracil-DNA glycosylase family protein, partial [Flavobacteriaceae bacterium]
ATLAQKREQLVFLLWGNYAKKKAQWIDRDKHLILTSGHPSPLSANRGLWFGNRHFSQCNQYLSEVGKTPIDWALPA